MNLNRAKTILIIAFLGLNIFLAYHLLAQEADRLPLKVVSETDLQEVEERLAENNYYLHTPIQHWSQKSAFLTVSPDRVVQQDLVKALEKEWTLTAYQDEVMVYQGKEVELSVYPTGLVELVYKNGLPIPDETAALAEEALLRRVESALRQNGFNLEAVRFDYIEVLDRSLIIHYYQVYDDKPLFSGYLTVSVSGNRIKAVELYLLDPLAEAGDRDQEMVVIPVTEALHGLAEGLEKSARRRRIIKAELGYFSLEYDAEKWEVPPVWRFLTDDNTVYYVNAFTGILEMDQ